MNEREFLEDFVNYCNQNGYGSAYSQKEIIPDFLANVHIKYYPTIWELIKKEDTWEQVSQRYSNMHLFFSVINEFSDPTEIYLVRRTDRKIVGRLVTDIGEAK